MQRFRPTEEAPYELLPLGDDDAAWEAALTAEESMNLARARRTQMGSDCSGARKIRTIFE